MTYNTKFDTIPAEMKAARRWVCWNENKAPVNPATKYGASSTNPDTWATFEQARAAVGQACTVGSDSGIICGVGFVLGDGWAGVDLDGGADHGGAAVDPQMLDDFRETLHTYCEKSKSGAGYHFIGRYNGAALTPSRASGVEIYTQGRYFAITGDVLQDCTLSEITDTLPKLHERYIAAAERQKHAQTAAERPQQVINRPWGQPAESGLKFPYTPAEIERMLTFIPADVDYMTWFRICTAIKGESETNGGIDYNTFDAWSRGGSKYRGRRETLKIWNSVTTIPAGPKAGTIAEIARRHGWTDNNVDRLQLQENRRRKQQREAAAAYRTAETATDAQQAGNKGKPTDSAETATAAIIARLTHFSSLRATLPQVFFITDTDDNAAAITAAGAPVFAFTDDAAADDLITLLGLYAQQGKPAAVIEWTEKNNREQLQGFLEYAQDALPGLTVIEKPVTAAAGPADYMREDGPEAMAARIRSRLDRIARELEPIAAAPQREAVQPAGSTQQPTQTECRPDNTARYIADAMAADIDSFRATKERKTGFENLDSKAGGLYPGLYCIAAISSLGKTTFAAQIADQLAAAGEEVLFFSIEQSRLELVSKSLARITAQRDLSTAVNSLMIRQGRIKGLQNVADAIQEYTATVGDRISIIEGNFYCTPGYIRGYTEKYINMTGKRPVVFVDYLQIMQPDTDKRQGAREIVDTNITELKRMSRDLNITVFVICSVNRSNYLTPIDFESLKESGCIEYTCDVVFGLQLQCLTDNQAFKGSNNTNITEKRDVVRAAKAETPRKIKLVCLKNRYGISSFECNFDYFPANDYFVPDAGEIAAAKRTARKGRGGR